MEDDRLVLKLRPPRWSLVLIAVYVTVVVVLAVTVVVAGDVRRLLSFALPAGFALVGLVVVVRPPRIELGHEEIVVRKLRTVRVPYTDIVAVRGDVPSRLDWSTHLVVERQEGAPVTLPPVEAPLTEVHDVVVARLG